MLPAVADHITVMFPIKRLFSWSCVSANLRTSKIHIGNTIASSGFVCKLSWLCNDTD